MLKIESYVAPIIESTLSKFINLQPNTLKISLWSGEAKLKNLDLKLDTLEYELNLPFKLLSGSIQEIKVNIPWTALGSQSIVITCSNLEVTLELKETQKAEIRDQLPEDSDDEFMDANDEFEYSHERSNSLSEAKQRENSSDAAKLTASTSNLESSSQPAINSSSPNKLPSDANEASYLDNLINKIKHNIKIEINNLVVKYQEPEFVVRATIEQLSLLAADEFWQPKFFDISKIEEEFLIQNSFQNEKNSSETGSNFSGTALPGNLNKSISTSDLTYNFRQICKITNLTMNIDSRDTNTGEIIETFPDPFLSKAQLEIRIFNVFKNKRAIINTKPNLIKIDLLFEKVNIAIADNQLPIAIRLTRLILALYYREFTWERTQAPKTPENQTKNEENSWTSWAMSMFGPSENEIEEKSDPLIILCGIYFRKFSVWLKTQETPEKSKTHRRDSQKGVGFSVPAYTKLNSVHSSEHIPYVSVFNFEIEGVGIEITSNSNLEFYSCIAGVTHIKGKYMGGLPAYPLPLKTESVTFLDLGIPVRKKTTYHYLSGSLFDYMSPENNSAEVEYYMDYTEHINYWTEEFFERRFGAFFSDYVYFLECSGWEKLFHDHFDTNSSKLLKMYSNL